MKRTTDRLGMLQPVTKPGLSAIRSPHEWIQVDVTVDFGVCASVMPADICEGISMPENAWSRGGAEYEFANGAAMPNL